MDFKRKVIVVTGGASGIGLQICHDLANKGANIQILGRDKNKLESAKKEILKSNKKAIISVHSCDISDYEQVKSTFKKIKKEYDNIYGLVNNAAINPSRNIITNTEKTDWDSTISTDLTGAFNCSKLAVEQMLENKSGVVISVSSVAGVKALPYRTSYNASKWGLIGLTQSIARDYAKHHIRANTVCPGFIRTPLTEKLFARMDPQKFELLVKRHPLKGLGDVKDISNAVCFLLSDEASWITGAVLPVDGGYLLGRDD